MIADPKRFDAAIAAFDAANAEDPNRDEGRPKELLYAQRMSAMLDRFAPDASEAVRLAVRAQHIQRWKTPRASYPMDRQGYLQWRTGLYKFHAETAGRILQEAGYDAGTIERVQAAVGKKGLKVNAETQLLEDVTDLVFLEHYLAGFAAQHPDYDEAKWIEIIRKTWQKMSAEARNFVLAGKVSLPEALTPLVLKAVS
ncbi:MAG: DUF4202 domain-containing protein [Rhodocyclales bacterium]|nr:MAG: DUF4202 domain-containing protein [Rhodocyclales bacterium]